MKRIILVRHGKADNIALDAPDFKRNLTDRGCDDARNIADRLKLLGLSSNIIVSSPAPRALQTARIIAEESGYVKRNILTRKALYDQLPGVVYEIVRALDDEMESVIIVGHNPTIEEVASDLCSGKGGLVPTSGVVAFKCKVKSWGDVDSGSGKLIAAFSPKNMPALGKSKLFPVYFEEKIENLVLAALTEIDENAANKTRKKISRAVNGIASKFIKNL